MLCISEPLDEPAQPSGPASAHPRLPSRHRVLAASVARVAPKGLPVRVDATPYVTVDIYEVKSGAKVVHLLNYENTKPVKNVKVELGVGFEGVGQARLYDPDGGADGAALELRKEAGRFAFVVPQVRTYAVVELT